MECSLCALLFFPGLAVISVYGWLLITYFSLKEHHADFETFKKTELGKSPAEWGSEEHTLERRAHNFIKLLNFYRAVFGLRTISYEEHDGLFSWIHLVVYLLSPIILLGVLIVRGVIEVAKILRKRAEIKRAFRMKQLRIQREGDPQQAHRKLDEVDKHKKKLYAERDAFEQKFQAELKEIEATECEVRLRLKSYNYRQAAEDEASEAEAHVAEKRNS